MLITGTQIIWHNGEKGIYGETVINLANVDYVDIREGYVRFVYGVAYYVDMDNTDSSITYQVERARVRSMQD